MADASRDLLEIVLRDVAEAGPAAWYPADYAQATGVTRDALDATLDQLRLAGLLRLTDWVQGKGQGYTLTAEGREVLANGRLMSRLRTGKEVPTPRVAQPAERVHPEHRDTEFGRGEAIRESLLNPQRPVVTQGLLIVNIGAFLFGLFLASQEGIFSEYLGENPRPGLQADKLHELRDRLGTLDVNDVVNRRQWWRLLSYAFVHLGLIHILMNMWVLYAIGNVVETLWGSRRFLIMYLTSALWGGAVALVASPEVGVGGASGALCGMLASMAVWVAMNRNYLPPRLVSDWGRNIMINIVLIVLISLMPRVSWAGHLGGGVGGFLVSVPLIYSLYGRKGQRALGWLCVAAVPALAVALLWAYLPWPRQLDRDAPEVVLAHRQVYEKYRKAEKLADDLHKQVEPFLLGTKTREKHQADADAAVKALSAGGEQIQNVAEEIKKHAAEYGKALRSHVVEGAQILAHRSTFCTLAASDLANPKGWPEQRRRKLVEFWRETDRLESSLRDSPVFRQQKRAGD